MDHSEMLIEVETLPHAKTGMWDRHLCTRAGGAMSLVSGGKRQIRVFHDAAKHGSFVITVDGDAEMLLERVSGSSLKVEITRPGAGVSRRFIDLELDKSVLLEDPSGRPMVLRRRQKPSCLLDELIERVNA